MNYYEILGLVKKPGRYIGGEVNAWQKNWQEADLRVCCIFPDLYEIGMSHQGLLILYDILNRCETILADRCYCPDIDLESLLKQHNMPLVSLESKRPLNEFDILAITLPYELCYTNIFTILSLSNIPFLSKERNNINNYPLILGGGSCCLNPEPIAEVFDAIVIGDGEEVIREISNIVLDAKKNRSTKKELLLQLSKLEGLYIPQFFKTIYSTDGVFKGIEPLEPGYEKVKRRIVSDFTKDFDIKKPLVPNIGIVHDRLGVEIARGCTRGCRYCQATTIYRPVREKSLNHILELAQNGIEKTGWEELSLLSLSTGDYSRIFELIPAIMDTFVPKHCSVSLPSLRIGTLTPEIMDQIKRVKKTGLTLAPEAGSQRLRQVINKDITEESLLQTVRSAYEKGWKNVKLYFMIGLPTETDQDIQALIELVKKVKAQRKGLNIKGHIQVTASIGTFVPKPQTPFQWEEQISILESKRRLELIKKALKAKSYQVKWHNPEQSFLEGVFSRGDRNLLKLLLNAWRKGARLDAWTDHLDFNLYKDVAKELKIDLDSYLKAIPEDKPLYWEHIDPGIKKDFLILEKERAYNQKLTPDCRFSSCQGCGVCDFKKIKPIIKKEKSSFEIASLRPSSIETTFFYKIVFEKVFESRFIGHLDLVKVFHRAIKRASLPIIYSKGFHPMPKISFGNPIPLGMESISEEALLSLERKLPEDFIQDAINKQLPLNLKVLSVNLTNKKITLNKKKEESNIFLIIICTNDKKDFLRYLHQKNKNISGITVSEVVNIPSLAKKWLYKTTNEISCNKKYSFKITVNQVSNGPKIKIMDILKSYGNIYRILKL